MKSAGEVKILYDFTRPDACPWPAIDDVVMGGVSRSSMRMEEGSAVFSGVVSLDHGGGFASVRSQPSLWDLGDYIGIELTLRGDGRRYKLRLKTDPSLDGVNWETAFATDAGARQKCVSRSMIWLRYTVASPSPECRRSIPAASRHSGS